MGHEKILWQPTEAFLESSHLFKYRTWLKDKYDLEFHGYEDLWQWSIDHLATFWQSIWEYFEVLHDGLPNQIIQGERMPSIEWFPGTKLNYSEHLFRFEDPNKTALIFSHENGKVKNISWDELRRKVSALQEKLIELGVGPGDRVAAILPNIPEAMIAFMAVNGLGAVWSCCSPDFGADTIYDRFSQIRPKLLIAVDGYWYNKKEFDRIEKISWLQSKIDSIQHTILLNYLNPHRRIENGIKWPDAGEGKKIIFNRVPFSHPMWVLYSSGTTGKPKAITHSHGGVLLEHLKYMAFHNDVRPGENFFWFSTTGWMMWNFLQASLLVGAKPVLYDGSPAVPDLSVLWGLCETLPIHHFGTSAPYLTALMKSGLKPGERFNLRRLRSIGSTGAPLPPEVFDWIYAAISPSVWLCSMSGGTDVCTAFVGGCPEKPVYSGRIQCRALGCAMQAYDDSGNPVIGALGEMVIEKPMPSMPVYFWSDPGNARYAASYFEEYPGKWRHGDFIKIFEDGSLIIEGRSDATLNRKGIRIGTAEIYNVIDEIEGVKDSLIINIEKSNGDDIMPLFITLRDGVQLDDKIKEEINLALRSKCSPRHVPDLILECPDIPYTLSGKKMEVPVKRIFMKNLNAKIETGAIRNPEAMQYFSDLAATNPFD